MEAELQLSKALAAAIEIVELRLDSFNGLDIEALRGLCTHFAIPMIFTLRSTCQGGEKQMDEGKRMEAIRQLLPLKPEYFDLEYHLPKEFIQEIAQGYPDIKLIISYHNFATTPDNLQELYSSLQCLPAHWYKMAVTAANSVEALRFICWAKEAQESGLKLIAISMGAEGAISRLLAPQIGSPLTYASTDSTATTAPGQLTVQQLRDRYHYSGKPQHKIYGLIGDPVEQSISDETHNVFFQACHLDAIYLKMRVHPNELKAFLSYAKELPFQGLSITMPLKEHILPFLDEIDSSALAIGAVNTLLFEQGRILGFNTDGTGCLDAIEQELPVRGKRLVIIGAGGASKAIAYEALRRGAKVTIINRTESKAYQFAHSLGCAAGGLDAMARCAQEGYDILINCTPSPSPIPSQTILPGVFVMDIVTKPKETPFLQLARTNNCHIIYGYQMFVQQALGQFRLWFKDEALIAQYQIAFEQCALKAISPQ
jgi:3-dehydroquinate dehydratase/shikimate dehydrogenase